MDDILLAGRLDGRQRNRLKRLMDVMLRPGELAEEVGFNKNQIYMVYIPAGCPHERDIHNHIWINGKHFQEWYKIAYKKQCLKAGETFCLTCKKGMPMVDEVRKEKNGLIYALSNCPNCGRALTRIIYQKRG